MMGCNKWEQERPTWCPHPTCKFIRLAAGRICCGRLPAPLPHNGDFNTHRVCLYPIENKVFDLQVNASDLEWFRWIFDAIDSKRTSWLSRRSEKSTQ